MTHIKQENKRNVAIIAHVDHGKTTLVDELFKQSGLYRENQSVSERVMDSMELEKERGITIRAKNGSCTYKDTLINIIDTPGHADFGGEVERVLGMADGALFLVDAAEGPMPQSIFVLKKAVALDIPIIVVVNKIDKQDARCDWVVDQVFDVLASMDAPDHILDFKTIYASAKEGISTTDLATPGTSMEPIFDSIIENIPAPKGDINAPFQCRITTLSYSSFFGRLAIGKVTSGQLKVNDQIAIARGEDIKFTSRASKLYTFEGPNQVEVDTISIGDLVAIAGIDDCQVGETITDPNNPLPLPMIEVDPPTLSVNILPNNSPFAGREGEFVTSRQIQERLDREVLGDVALQVDVLTEQVGFKVSGRGELHLSILVEKMRREGYEFQVSKPHVIFKEDNGKKLEPYEIVTIDVDESCMGTVIESLGKRKGHMIDMVPEGGITRIRFKIPTRGLLGYQSQFMTETRGMGIMNMTFDEYGPFTGEIKTRQNGVLISKEACTTVAFALFNLQERGKLFLGPGVDLYEGQIIGENARQEDMVVNPAKGKKLSNMRASGSDDTVALTPPIQLSLEEFLAYIEDDELVEVTPKSIRLRKRTLNESDRKRLG